MWIYHTTGCLNKHGELNDEYIILKIYVHGT